MVFSWHLDTKYIASQLVLLFQIQRGSEIKELDEVNPKSQTVKVDCAQDLPLYKWVEQHSIFLNTESG